MRWKFEGGVLIWAGLFLLFSPLPARADRLPPRAYIRGVKGHAQSFSLSCESRSAVDWAAFWGVSIGEKKFLSRLPRSKNPDTGFVGDPTDPWGNVPPASYGVHAEPVAKLLRDLGLPAEARKNLSWDDLRAEIAGGRPVIVWVVGQMWKGHTIKYAAPDGHISRVASFEHTMILIGYGPDQVNVIDAYSGREQVYPLRSFLASWGALSRMAVVYVPTTTSSSQDEVRVYLPLISRFP